MRGRTRATNDRLRLRVPVLINCLGAAVDVDVAIFKEITNDAYNKRIQRPRSSRARAGAPSFPFPFARAIREIILSRASFVHRDFASPRRFNVLAFDIINAFVIIKTVSARRHLHFINN